MSFDLNKKHPGKQASLYKE